MFSSRDEYWMQQAIHLAETAAAAEEVPVGAILVLEDNEIGRGFNQPICHHDPTAHAEIVALRAGAQALKNYRLVNTTLYVTLEPCMMCIGALVHARIKRLVFGAFDPRAGAVTSAFQIIESDKFNHRIQWQGGLLAEKCGNLLSEFFRAKR